MLKLKGKLLLTLFFGAVVSTLITGTAFAGVSISGNSQVYPGSTYTYTITVTENASSIMGTASTGGVLGSHSATWSKDSSSGLNSSITATATITVTIPSSAAIGSTGTITVSGQGSSFDPNTSTVSKFTISGSKSVTVVTPPTPTPTPPPTPWELAIREIKRVENGGSITIEMDPESAREINVPVEAFKTIQDMSVVLTIDYGSFKCVVDGSKVGVLPESKEDVNMGITLKPAERADDMLVFTVNNTSQFFYIVDYLIEPFVAPTGDFIYVYREYESISLLEYVNSADTDGNGNISVKVFAPGKYIVSAEGIAGSEGNMDAEALIEMFATPTPEPTATPTFTPQPTPTATLEPIEEKTDNKYIPYIFAGVLVVLIGILIRLILVRKERNSVN